MAELLTCRRLTKQVGGGTACQLSGPTDAQTTCSALVEYPAEAGAALPDAGAGGAPTGVRLLLDLLPFAEIWAVDFEFGSDPGENPEPVCLVAWELRTGRRLHVWRDDFGAAPPYPTGPDVLFVAYYASAEIGCHLASAGRCPSACWTCSLSSAITPTAFPRPAARACSARLPITAWTASAPSRKTKCAT